MSDGITRRRLGALIAAAPVMAARAQTAAPQAANAELDPGAAVRERRKRVADQLAKVKLPMPTEPAFVFRA